MSILIDLIPIGYKYLNHKEQKTLKQDNNIFLPEVKFLNRCICFRKKD